MTIELRHAWNEGVKRGCNEKEKSGVEFSILHNQVFWKDEKSLRA